MTQDKNLDDILASIRKIVVEDGPAATVIADDIDEALLDPDFDSLPLTGIGETKATLAAPEVTDIDATARALLKPMLQAWLDANLPEIVEAAVAVEIRRLTGRG